MSGKLLLVNVDKWIAENEKAFLPPVHFCQLNIMCVCVCVTHAPCPPVSISGPQTFLLPARIPHSPQRLDNTVGLVSHYTRTLLAYVLSFSVYLDEDFRQPPIHMNTLLRPSLARGHPIGDQLYGPGQTEVCKREADVWIWHQVQYHYSIGAFFPQSTGDSLLIPGHSQKRARPLTSPLSAAKHKEKGRSAKEIACSFATESMIVTLSHKLR
uniref:Uncharacterized protein n=1 Tax=Hucho hucho TaxID=62062 RepID=A0A4W5M4E3_9TELE